MDFYESGTNNSIRKGKVNSETLNGSTSNVFCVLLLLLPSQRCLLCDLTGAPLRALMKRGAQRGYTGHVVTIKLLPMDGAFCVWLPNRKLFFL